MFCVFDIAKLIGPSDYPNSTIISVNVSCGVFPRGREPLLFLELTGQPIRALKPARCIRGVQDMNF